MVKNFQKILKKNLSKENHAKLMALQNEKLHRFVADAIALCQPQSVFVCTDSAEDIAYIRRLAIERGEEKPLATEGHTYHFDGPNDQGRDREVTKYLVPKTETLSKALNQIERQEGRLG